MSSPSTPAAPLLARTRLSARCRFSLVNAAGNNVARRRPCRSGHVAGRRLRRWQVHARLHRALPPPAPLARASDALPLASTCRPTLLLVRSFTVRFSLCGLPRLLRPLLTSRCASSGRRPFRREARSPQVRTRSFTTQSPHLRRLTFGHKSFAECCLLALVGVASYAVRVPRLMVYAPRFLSTLGHPRAVALHLPRCGQLGRGLAPRRSRPCWAHNNSLHSLRSLCSNTFDGLVVEARGYTRRRQVKPLPAPLADCPHRPEQPRLCCNRLGARPPGAPRPCPHTLRRFGPI